MLPEVWWKREVVQRLVHPNVPCNIGIDSLNTLFPHTSEEEWWQSSYWPSLCGVHNLQQRRESIKASKFVSCHSVFDKFWASIVETICGFIMRGVK